MAQGNKGKITVHSQADKHFWLCYGTEGFLVRQNAKEILSSYLDSGLAQSDFTVVEGASPDMESLLAACGTISMFGGLRLVYLPDLEFTALTDKGAAEFCRLVEETENAVLVAACISKEAKAASSKKAKLLIECAEKNGMEIASDQMSPQNKEAFLVRFAQELGAEMDKSAARLLMETCNMSLEGLLNEVSKLAAGAAYTEIDTATVEKLATRTVEADVFAMVDALVAKNAPKTFSILRDLLENGNDEIAICGAIAGSYIDMYRVKCGKEKGKAPSAVHRDMHYTGSDWRLKKSAERAAPFTLSGLAGSISLLAQLDLQLKSSGVNSRILLENAVAELME